MLYPLSYEGDALRILPEGFGAPRSGRLWGTSYNALNFN